MLLAIACFMVACAPYKVIQRSGPPSALAGMDTLYVQFDYSRVQISSDRMSEAQWLETREKEQHRNTYLETKNSANTGILGGLSNKLEINVAEGAAPAGAVQATVTYLEWEEGLYAKVVAWPSRVVAHVIFSIDGEVVDEIKVASQEQSTLIMVTPQQRISVIGKRLGQNTARFIAKASG